MNEQDEQRQQNREDNQILGGAIALLIGGVVVAVVLLLVLHLPFPFHIGGGGPEPTFPTSFQSGSSIPTIEPTKP